MGLNGESNKAEPRLVGKGDWVTFPLEQKNAIQIEWSDSTQARSAQSATYYIDKCWFGQPISNPSDVYTQGLNYKDGGIALIFIAAECIEDRTAHSPVPELRKNHIRDRMEDVRKMKDHENFSDKWALLKINDQFHYGQDDGKTIRWLVYHAGLGFRDVFQHRFGLNTVVNCAKMGVDFIGQGVKAGAGATFLKPVAGHAGSVTKSSGDKIIGFVCKASGHYLRVFTTDGDVDPKEDPKEKPSMRARNVASTLEVVKMIADNVAEGSEIVTGPQKTVVTSAQSGIEKPKMPDSERPSRAARIQNNGKYALNKIARAHNSDETVENLQLSY